MTDQEKQELRDFFHDINNFLTASINYAEMFNKYCDGSCTKEKLSQQKILLNTSILSTRKIIEKVRSISKTLFDEDLFN